MFKLSVVVTPVEAEFKAVARVRTLKEAAEKVAEHGFEGVELSLLDPKAYEPGALERVLSEHSLELPAFSTGLNFLRYGYSLSSPDPSLREAAVKRLKDFVDLAEPLGAGVVVGLMRGKTLGGLSREDAYRLMLRGLREVCRYAEEKGVAVLFEPLNRYETDLVNTVDEGLRVLEEIGSPALKLLLDTFHMNIEEARIEESVRRAKGKIGHFHVADSNRLAPGMGHLDFRSILGALKDTGYTGFLSVEVVIKPSLEAVLETAARTLKPIIEELK